MVARAQWLKTGYSNAHNINCMNVLTTEASIITEAVAHFKDKALCRKYGCPELPVVFSKTTFDQETSCIQVSFFKDSGFSQRNSETKYVDMKSNLTV
jgi:hypothetical protein